MASITKRKNSYLIRVSAGYDVSGNQITKSMTWKIPEGMSEKKAEKEAYREAILFEEKVRNGEVLDGRIKFEEYAEQWFRDYAEPQLRIRTVSSYRSHMPQINEVIGHLYLDKIKPQHILKVYAALSEPVVKTLYIGSDKLKETFASSGLMKKELVEKTGLTKYKIDSCFNGKGVSHEDAKKVAENLNLSLASAFETVESSYALSGKTLLNYHAQLSSMFAWAVNWQLIPFNPVERVKPPKVEKKEQVCFDDEDAIKILEYLEEEPLQKRLATTMLLFTGFRRGELLGLKWSDIDFEHNLISIRRSVLYDRNAGIFVDETKNSSSLRTIKTSQHIMDLLKHYKISQAKDRLKLGETWKDENWIFTRWNGEVINPNDLTVWIKKFIRKHDLPEEAHLHTLRHTNASLLIANGTNLQTVAKRLGHVDTNTTLKIYSHAIQSADAVASETLDLALNYKAVMNK